MDKTIIKITLISGPRYGIIFRMAQIKAITNEFSTPRIRRSV
jgi:hypothetical protein